MATYCRHSNAPAEYALKEEEEEETLWQYLYIQLYSLFKEQQPQNN